MAKGVDLVKIDGLQQAQKTLTELLPRESLNIARRTAGGIARKLRTEIKKKAKKKTGNLAKNIKSKRAKDYGRPNLASYDVYVERDGFYWRFIEHGTAERKQKKTGKKVGKMSPDPFVTPTVEAFRPQMPILYREEFGKQLEKELAKRNK
jgi:HK97 gp10 family phage protein